MTDKIGVAVIGAGVAGRVHAHGYRSAGTVLGLGLPEVRLVSVADADEDLARDAAARYGFERADSSWQAVAENPDVDVVSVVVASPLHRDIVTALATAGQHVLCERPLAATTADARAMIDAVERAGVIARVGSTYRRAPGISALRDQISSGRLGRAVHFSGHYWTDYGCDPRAPMSWRYRGGPGSGALADLGSHLTDVAEFLFGPVESVRGATLARVVAERPVPLGHVVGNRLAAIGEGREPVENDDWASFSLTFASGATGDLSVSRIAFGHPNTLKFEVFGEEGAAAFDAARPGEFEIATTGLPEDSRGFRRVTAGIGFANLDSFVYQARAFLDEVAGREELPRCASFAEGLHNLEVLDAAARSATGDWASVRVTS
jgi:predicted dehydrogenase